MKKLSTCIMLSIAMLFSLNVFSIPKLNSLPSASATVFLDFDGQTVVSGIWNGGNPIFCAAAGLSDLQITEVFNRVAEDYRPFNINITTDSTVFLAAPLVKRMRLIITPTSAWCPGAGGIALVGSFTRGDDTPCFAFSDRLGPNYAPYIAEACSHESGHTLGLLHQSKYGSDCVTPIETYNTGTGTGETGWAPIMGNSYYRNFTNWNNGPTPDGCTVLQDNLNIIATQNGFTYRADDYGETMNSGTFSLPAVNFSINGIITTNTDKDAFKLTLSQNSSVHLTANPNSVASGNTGANLDIKLQLYNSTGSLISTYDPTGTLSVTVDTSLTSGTYYLMISGTGNANISSYGSLGSYSFSGTTGTLPIHDISLTGTVEKNKHSLSWTIIADEPIRSINIETSTDGTNFRTLTGVGANVNRFSYDPYQTGTLYYRLKVTSVTDQSLYSNTVVLRGNAVTDQTFFVSTLVQHDILVNASVNFHYRLTDMNGRGIVSGTGIKGINKISLDNQPSGMYIIELYNNNLKQTERIIKQ